MRVHTTQLGQKQIFWGLNEKMHAFFTEPCLSDTCEYQYCDTIYKLRIGGMGSGIELAPGLTQEEAVQRGVRILTRLEGLPLVSMPNWIAQDRLLSVVHSPHKGLVSARRMRSSYNAYGKRGKIVHLEIEEVTPKTEAAIAALMRLR